MNAKSLIKHREERDGSKSKEKAKLVKRKHIYYKLNLSARLNQY